MDVRTRLKAFVPIVHFLNDKWEPCHVIVGCFETTKPFRSVMALQVNEVLINHGFNA